MQEVQEMWVQSLGQEDTLDYSARFKYLRSAFVQLSFNKGKKMDLFMEARAFLFENLTSQKRQTTTK